MFALVLAGVLVGLARGWQGPAVINAAAARVLAPITHGLRGVRAQVGFVSTSARRLEALEAENAQLRQENARQQVDQTKLGQLERENSRLKDLLGFKNDRLDLDLLGASVRAAVIGAEPGGLVHGIWIDQGRDDGVEAGDPVVTERGLVGRVVRVFGQASQVQLIRDGASAVGARVERSGAPGMLFGSASGALTLRYVPQNGTGQPPNVVVGDIVHTSGLDQDRGFPKLIPIGQVTEVRQSDERPHQEAVVRPSVDLANLEAVLVVTAWRAAPLPEGDDPPPSNSVDAP